MKKKIYLSLLFMIGMILFPLGVNAEESYSITATATKVGTDVDNHLEVTLNGIEKHEKGLPYYYIYICNETDSAPTVPTSGVPDEKFDIVKGWHIVDSETGKVSITDDLYVYKDMTAYVLKITYKENTTDYEYTLSDKVKVELPGLFAPGTGYDFIIGDKTGLWKTNSNVWPKFPERNAFNGKIKVKVGIINDKTIISKYAKKTSDAYSSLLNYATNATNGITMVNGADGLREFSSKIDKIIEGTQYYVLITPEDSAFRNLTDVYIRTGSNIGTLDEFSGENDSTTIVKSTSTTVKNPKTADINILIYIGILIVTIGGIIISYRKLKKVK